MEDGNFNGVAVSPDGLTVYVSDGGGASANSRNPYSARSITSFNLLSRGGKVLPVPQSERLFSNPVAYFYDGVVSREGNIFAGAGEGIDVLGPESGNTLGTIRVGGGKAHAITLALGDHEAWIVGRGGAFGKFQILRLDWIDVGKSK